MEKMIEKHLKDNAAMGYSQHGFRRGKSCPSTLISFYDRVTLPVDQGKPMSTSWTSVKLSILALTGPFWTKCPELDEHIMGWHPTDSRAFPTNMIRLLCNPILLIPVPPPALCCLWEPDTDLYQQLSLHSFSSSCSSRGLKSATVLDRNKCKCLGPDLFRFQQKYKSPLILFLFPALS